MPAPATLSRTLPELSSTTAAAVASSAFLAPLWMSVGANPSPAHPRTLVWYRMLRKPSFQPPDWAIPVAWLAIEAGLAFGGYRLCRKEPSRARDRALAAWAVNVMAIGGWSWLFFRQRRLGVSTAAAAALVATGTAYVARARPVDREAAAAGLPFVGWVAFATVLTASLWALNRRSR